MALSKQKVTLGLEVQAGLEEICQTLKGQPLETVLAAEVVKEEILAVPERVPNTVAVAAEADESRLTAQGKKAEVLFMAQGEVVAAERLLQLLAVLARLVHGRITVQANLLAVLLFRVNMDVATAEMAAWLAILERRQGMEKLAVCQGAAVVAERRQGRVMKQAMEAQERVAR